MSQNLYNNTTFSKERQIILFFLKFRLFYHANEEIQSMKNQISRFLKSALQIKAELYSMLQCSKL